MNYIEQVNQEPTMEYQPHIVALKDMTPKELRALMNLTIKTVYFEVTVKCPQKDDYTTISFQGKRASIAQLMNYIDQDRYRLSIPQDVNFRVQDHWMFQRGRDECLDKEDTTKFYTKYKDYINQCGTVEDPELNILNIETKLVFYVHF
jgi:hypothetical protein